MLGHDSSTFSFLRPLHSAFTMAALIYIPTNSVRGFPFLHFITNIRYSCFCFCFYDSHSDRCEVIFLCGFDLYFLMLSEVEHFFTCCWPSAFPVWKKCLFSSSAHFF